ncbi:hypothetical protein [Desulfosporosinus sp. FKB]|uniref:hypothetical protein n=1 Tax=Desulfosporosinus sp. FKB TaxID=1969835 RepID=UPI000B49E98B|nr:hypothetical protein [Desulfosporosinus sp. FKB]
MQTTNHSDLKEELILTLDYVHNLFIRNEDSQALKELDPVLQKMGSLVEEMPALVQETFQQLLLQALKFLETKDYVRLMDVLIFEIKPLFKD